MALSADGAAEPGMTTSLAPEVAQIAEEIRGARQRQDPLRIIGAGSWLDAGQPCSATQSLHVGSLQGIVTYEPGDLTLTARAGTTLADIERITAAEGQWLTLDPHGVPDGTLGATVASGSYGPLASAFGTPRDHVLGCEFVSGTGDVVRAGGRVVKNVAGFDLVRLVTGSWGTIGALTEITVRLRARPEHDRTSVIGILRDTPMEAVDAAWRWLRESEYAPYAAEIVSPTLAGALGLPKRDSLVARFGGNESFVRAAIDAVASLGDVTDAPVSVWRSLTSSEPSEALVVRLSTRPSQIGALWARASGIAERAGGFAHATPVRGVVRCVIPYTAGAGSLEELHLSLTELATDCTVVAERAPAPLWNTLMRERSTDALAARVRRAFDPDRVLNAGILGENA
jgi:glycolate oxidase FAD binding subunit